MSFTASTKTEEEVKPEEARAPEEPDSKDEGDTLSFTMKTDVSQFDTKDETTAAEDKTVDAEPEPVAKPEAQDSDEMDFDSLNMRMRLLKVYANSKNREAFDGILEKIPEALKNPDNADWMEIVNLQNHTWPEDGDIIDETDENQTTDSGQDGADWGSLSFAGGGDEQAEESSDDSESAMSAEDKLKLAQTYIDLEDVSGAKSLLEDVLEQGDDKQKAQAKELLGKIADS